MAGHRRWVASAALLFLITACGDDSSTSSGNASTEATPGSDAAQPEPGDAAPVDNGAGDGGGSAIIISGDTTLRFSMDDITFSPFEGVDDTTFETCDASFFGAAFRAIGYPVDEAGELILEDGRLAGILTLTLPLDEAGEAAAGPAEFDLDYSPLGFDLKIASGERLAAMATGVEPSWSFDGNRVSGTVVLANVRSEPTVAEFDISCS